MKATRSPSPAQLESTQLTFSAEPKEGPLFTDGARIYLNSRGIPSEMAASGGPVVPMHILGPGIFYVWIFLPDGSQALGLKPEAGRRNWPRNVMDSVDVGRRTAKVDRSSGLAGALVTRRARSRISPIEHAVQNRCGWAKFAQDLGRAGVS